MSWKELNDNQEWNTILMDSYAKPQVLFKHSTRCSISLIAKSRIEKSLTAQDSFYLLDLLQHRSISNQIAQDLQITHESPQVLVIKDGICIYHESHTAITYDNIIAAIQQT